MVALDLVPLTIVVREGAKLLWKESLALKQTVWSITIFKRFLSFPHCDRVVVIMRANQLFQGRNLLKKYKQDTRVLLEHPHATLALVYGSCNDMLKKARQ